jgi:cell division protein FtsB
MSAGVAALSSATPRVRRSGRSTVGRARITTRAVGLAIVSLLVLSLGISPLRAYVQQRGRLSDLQRQAQQLEGQNAQLANRVQELRDPAVLERLARQCLGLVRPGETAFITVPKHGAPTPPAC